MSIKETRQISTKAGDHGTSKDYSNRTFQKSHILFETLGTIDELSSQLGLAYHYCKCTDLKMIQKELQSINSLIATDPASMLYAKLPQTEERSVFWLEDKMQQLLNDHPLEPKFTLPGSEKSLNGAYVDVARAVCRRAERRLAEFVLLNQREDLNIVQSYLNRLSDFLFVLSCNLA